VGASLEVMERDSRKMRGERPFIFTNLREDVGLDFLLDWLHRRLVEPVESRARLVDAHAPYVGRTHSHGPGHSHDHAQEPSHGRGHS
jgi:urease accessory protein